MLVGPRVQSHIWGPEGIEFRLLLTVLHALHELFAIRVFMWKSAWALVSKYIHIAIS